MRRMLWRTTARGGSITQRLPLWRNHDHGAAIRPAGRRCSTGGSITTRSIVIPPTASDDESSSSCFPRIIETSNADVPIHLYADEIEPQAMEQVRILAEQTPIPVGPIAVMPDAHLGKGVTIGTVFASEKYICPNAVGVDIGCGMAAIPIDGLYKEDLMSSSIRVKLQQHIKERIPTGFNQHQNALSGTKDIIDKITAETPPSLHLMKQLTKPRVTDQLGTLGGGNHFIEILYDDTPSSEQQQQQVWCMLHSGSRNIGNRIATYYDQCAQKYLLKQYRDGMLNGDTKSLRGIHYMPIESKNGQEYIQDMEWCQQYAYYNRSMMQKILLEIIYQTTKKDADLSRMVNIHHNYCTCEEHYYNDISSSSSCNVHGNKTKKKKKKLWITRKGATSAHQGQLGIIPGSMGTGSYITRGKGNPQSWNSSSHGAGRRMSRTAAHSTIDQESFESAMEGIVCDTHPSVKDEAPQAYKDLNVVMKQQESLTETVHRLLPLVNVKGFEKKLPRKYRSSNNDESKSEQKKRNRRKKRRRQQQEFSTQDYYLNH